MQTQSDSNDQDGGVFVMRCWVRADGELAGRVRWSIVEGEHQSLTLGGAADLVGEAQRFLRRLTHQVGDVDVEVQ